MNKKDFANPKNEYRSVPFWSLNDELKTEILTKQIDEFAKQGMGGFFLHARSGLITPYLSPVWMNMLSHCVKKAKEKGLYAWLYDEDCWPSGRAGGMVTKLNPRYRQKCLVCEEIKQDNIYANSVAKANIKYTNKEVKEYIFFIKETSLADLLNPDAVDTFIKLTHEAYKKYIGKEFGKTVPGIFTDEPLYSAYSFAAMPSVPWTDELPQLFYEDYGYSILESIHSLFFDIEDYKKVRHDFWLLLTKRFIQSYSKKLYDWCEKNKIKYTGHYEWEDSLLGQIRCVGSVMPHYEYMQMPGIDHLGRSLNNPQKVKQLSSVANQLGKERVLCEIYGVAGQNLSFQDRRWIGNWVCVLGINFLNHHLSLYSMRGLRKRDYPPNLFYPQPWWKYNKVIEDYFARLSYALSQGERIVDILVLHPMSSVWCEYSPNDSNKVEEIDKSFNLITKNLLSIQYDFDLGDELILAKYGKVKGKNIIVGKMKYSLLIIPPMTSIETITFNLVKEFMENGGSILSIEQKPYMVDGNESDELKKLMEKIPLIENKAGILKKKLDLILKGKLTISSDNKDVLNSIYIQNRKIGDNELFFIVNTNFDKEANLKIKFKNTLNVEEWDCETGEINLLTLSSPLKGERKGEGNNIPLYLAPGAGKLLITKCSETFSVSIQSKAN